MKPNLLFVTTLILSSLDSRCIAGNTVPSGASSENDSAENTNNVNGGNFTGTGTSGKDAGNGGNSSSNLDTDALIGDIASSNTGHATIYTPQPTSSRNTPTANATASNTSNSDSIANITALRPFHLNIFAINKTFDFTNQKTNPDSPGSTINAVDSNRFQFNNTATFSAPSANNTAHNPVFQLDENRRPIADSKEEQVSNQSVVVLKPENNFTQTVRKGKEAKALTHSIAVDTRGKTPSLPKDDLQIAREAQKADLFNNLTFNSAGTNNTGKSKTDSLKQQPASALSDLNIRTNGAYPGGSFVGSGQTETGFNAGTRSFVEIGGGPSCPQGKYGTGCNESCGHCHAGDANCNPDNGICQAGCEFGWMGLRCLTACGHGTWGDHCYGCGHCIQGHSQCDKASGLCKQGCQSGWHGLQCLSQCGHCLYGPGSCDQVTGLCQGGCMAGWTGLACHAPCRKNQWGENCSQLCGQCADDSCNSTDGRCTKGCVIGWKNDYCTIPCNGNTYGPNCNLTCGHCRKEKGSPTAYVTCHRATGDCSAGCDPGWTGARCDSPCPNGTYGLNCSQTCPVCGPPAECTCNTVTGACNYGLCPQSMTAKKKLETAFLVVSGIVGFLVSSAALIGGGYWLDRRRRSRTRHNKHENETGDESQPSPIGNADESSPEGTEDYPEYSSVGSEDAQDTQDGAP